MQTVGPGATGRSPWFTLEERFEFGNFTIPEVRALKCCSHTSFYKDVHRGLVSIEKIGAKSIIRGPVARRYIEGRPPIRRGAPVP
jgi:hypothetical protein